MKIDDFRFMRRGIPYLELQKEDLLLLNPIKQCSTKKDRALLLLHGYTSTPAVFRVMLPLLSFYDAIYCPVLPGHADSIAAFSQITLKDWLTSAEEQAHTIQKEFKKLDVMGFSLGGLLGSHLSHRMALNHLYLLAPAFELYRPPYILARLAKIFQWLGFKELRCRSGDLYTDEYYEIAYRKMPITTVIELLTLIQQTPLPNPNCPIDLFLGQYDKVVCSERIEERFSSRNNVKIHWLPNSAHIIPLDGDVQTIVDSIKASHCS